MSQMYKPSTNLLGTPGQNQTAGNQSLTQSRKKYALEKKRFKSRTEKQLEIRTQTETDYPLHQSSFVDTKLLRGRIPRPPTTIEQSTLMEKARSQATSPNGSADIIFIPKIKKNQQLVNQVSQPSLLPDIGKTSSLDYGKEIRPDSPHRIRVKQKINRDKTSRVRGRNNKSQKHGAWESDLRLPEGLTFAEIGQLSTEIKPTNKKVDASKQRAKDEQVSKFIEKNRELINKVNLKFIPWSSID